MLNLNANLGGQMSKNIKEYKKAIDYIIELIRDGKLSVGAKLPSERTLSAELEISRNSTREALRNLENMGIIESRHGSGNYITCEISNTLSLMLEVMLNVEKFSINELNFFRKSIDKMVCSMLIEQNDNLEEIADRAEELLNTEALTPEDEMKIDEDFHFFLIEETKNRLLISLMRAATQLYRRAIDSVLNVSGDEKRKGFVDAHRKIVKAIRSGSKASCDEAVELHYKRVDDIVKQSKLSKYNDNRIDLKNDVGEKLRNIFLNNQEEHITLEKDYLTGLYSKDVFFDKAEKYIKEHPNEDLMLWVSDIQGLRFINEKHGMEIGDKVLQVVASSSNRFEKCIYGGRIDGGSFCALMHDNSLDYKDINKKMLEEYDEELPIPNVVVKNGIYHVEKNDVLSVKAMYVRAFLALQSIKNSCDYMVMEYDGKMREELLLNRQMEEDAKCALKRGDFKVYFQPKIDVVKNVVGGAEALVRWIHPELGFLSPGKFIPLFEQNGFIAKLDLYIWEEVCKALVEWKDKGIPIVPISVNVSKKSFEDEKLAEKIMELVDKYNIDHSLVEIEITEYSCLGNMDKIYNTINQLHKSKFPIALDDFGTGYSSMIVLSKFDLDIMKLDMSLIQNDNLDNKKNALEIALQLAKMMQLKTVAEGIETEEQAKRIQSLGGDYIQGYYYSKPLPKEEFEEYLKNNLKA